MPATIRPATTEDIPAMVELLLADAREHHAEDAQLWHMADDAASQVELLEAAGYETAMVWSIKR